MTGAGACHPATSTPSFAESNGLGITNTIGRAELAAITATSHILQQTASRLLLPNYDALAVP